MDKKMQTLFIVIAILLVVVVILLAAALYVQSQQTVRSLAERIAALEANNRKSLNHFTADRLMDASYALNMFRGEVELLDTANELLKQALNPEKYSKRM